MLIPLNAAMPRTPDGPRAGRRCRPGDVLRRSARTPRGRFPRPRRINATETLDLAPVATRRRRSAAGCSPGTASSRTTPASSSPSPAPRRAYGAAGAHPRPRHRRDRHRRRRSATRSPARRTTSARAPSSTRPASGPATWSSEIRLRPSRGTHLVLREAALPRRPGRGDGAGARSQQPLRVRAPPARRHVLRRPHRRAGRRAESPTCPSRSEDEIDFLLGVISIALRQAATPRRGRRGLRRTAAPARSPARTHGRPVPQARGAHVRAPASSTVVGGKLTTYRRMAQDAVDAPSPQRRLAAGPCRTARSPLLGAAAPDELRGARRRPPGWCAASARTPRSCSPTPARSPAWPTTSCSPRSREDVPVTLAELVFGVTHEGAHDVDDLLDRRTRIGLVADRPRGRRAARPARPGRSPEAPPTPRDPDDSEIRR